MRRPRASITSSGARSDRDWLASYQTVVQTRVLTRKSTLHLLERHLYPGGPGVGWLGLGIYYGQKGRRTIGN